MEAQKLIVVDIPEFLKHLIYAILGHTDFEVVKDIDTDSNISYIVKLGELDYRSLIGKEGRTISAIKRIMIVIFKRRFPRKKIYINLVRR